MHVRVSPHQPTRTYRQVTFDTSLPDLLAAARLAAPRVEAGSGRIWAVDGHTSESLVLRLAFAPEEEQWFHALDLTLDLDVGEGQVTLGLLTKAEPLLGTFDDFVEHVGALLKQGEA